MEKRLYRICFALLLVLPGITPLSAQKLEIGVMAGGAGYMGDLNPRKFQRYTDPSLGALLRWNINPRNSLKFSFIHGTVQANDATSGDPYQTERNLHFRSPLNEFSFQFEFNFFRYNPLWGREGFSPYVFAGLSVVNFDPMAKDSVGNWMELRELGTEGQGLPDFPAKYKLAGLALPLGLGFKLNLRRNWNLFGEMGYRFAFSDYIDDVGGYYPDPAMLETAEAAYFSDRRILRDPPNPAGMQRGDLLKKDTYLFAVIGISYTFVSSWCPAFSDWGKE